MSKQKNQKVKSVDDTNQNPVTYQIDPDYQISVNGKDLTLVQAKQLVLATLAKVHEHVSNNNFELAQVLFNSNYNDALYGLIDYSTKKSLEIFVESFDEAVKNK